MLEFWFVAVAVALCVFLTLWMNHERPVPTGRHERDRNSVEAIRARVETEDKGRADSTGKRPVG
ncbi:hypothetical protein [Nocardia seriolae]|uniref:Uncharacterized protein n=1 Tax=Nocardia seriolae TaxID=37332 RepID=A0ABC8AKZ8_9NOCA|nr:hypothetical protein [Nocardia seriolae]APA94807.1 hypothetical protein NS506_00728 [Nocardia seriolae]OJF83499.1 hypothetical protein NS14008_35850 [Nocardia seriolae]PSK28571.1 hypothetical protein C6575_25705 [Nocardia seriolae]QOW32288.1 hypothetical protein IMZ23_30540 [Nocardia seriolae]QUN19897.1 hypothetical protein KEC46_11615 [Nocardia seriolae]